MSGECSSCGESLTEDEIRCSECLEFVESRLTSAVNQYYNNSNVVSNPDSDTYRKRETFHEKVRLVFPRVQQVASENRITNQSEIWGDGVDFWAMKHYLGAVSSIEHWDGRPLLTSVIINADREYPAEKYFQLVEWLDGLPNNILDWSDPEQEEWWEDQVEQVHDIWSNRSTA